MCCKIFFPLLCCSWRVALYSMRRASRNFYPLCRPCWKNSMPQEPAHYQSVLFHILLCVSQLYLWQTTLCVFIVYPEVGGEMQIECGSKSVLRKLCSVCLFEDIRAAAPKVTDQKVSKLNLVVLFNTDKVPSPKT